MYPAFFLLDVQQKSLESVIYYASYLVTAIDEEKKQQALDTFTETIEKRKQVLQDKLDDEEKRIETEVKEKMQEEKFLHVT